jgi:neutral trehalase
MRDAKKNYKEALKGLKADFNDEKEYADKRDTGLLDRWYDTSDSRYSLYEMDFDNFGTSKDGKTYAIYLEQDKVAKEAQYEHMVHIEFPSIDLAKAVFALIKQSSFTCIFSPATAS